MDSNAMSKIELDLTKLETIKVRILTEEKQNVKTKQNTKESMIEILRNIIIEEVNKKY